MNRKLISGVLVFALATAWYACTEDTESKQETSSTSSLNAKGSPKTSPSGRTSTVWNTEVGGPISYETAQAWIKTYRDKNPDAIRSRFFGKSAFERIFNNPAAVGISITYAIDDTGTPVLLLMGVDANGKIMAQPSTTKLAEGVEPSDVLDLSFPCPSSCPTNDPNQN